MTDPLSQRTDPLYQKEGQKHKHISPITSTHALSSLSPETQSFFKPPPETEPYVLTTPSTIFHAQGGGQPSDTGTISAGSATFHVHQVRKVDAAILHMGVFASSEKKFDGEVADAEQQINAEKRHLYSRIHTAGHVIGLAVAHLKTTGSLDPNVVDGKASHYPSAAFVEFSGLIPGDKKAEIQARVDEMVAADMDVKIHFWDEQKAKKECTGVMENLKGDEEDGVRVVEIGSEGSYPCGGTHVLKLNECGKIVVRNIKRQKGVTKVSYEVQNA